MHKSFNHICAKMLQIPCRNFFSTKERQKQNKVPSWSLKESVSLNNNNNPKIEGCQVLFIKCEFITVDSLLEGLENVS